MKKTFKLYIAAWAVMLALFNVVVFSVRALPGFKMVYDLRFWISWTVVILSYIGNLFCAYKVFSAENKDKIFLSIPLITLSYGATVVITVVSGILMLIPACPAWIAAVVSVVTLALNAVSVIKAEAAAQIVGDTETKIKTQTFFIKALTVDADTLMAGASSEAVKAECRRVYEAIRYSDPMSSDALAGAESQLTLKFSELSEAVKADDAEKTAMLAKEFLVLLNDRNKKCMLLK